MTAHQKFDLIEKFETFEILNFSSCVVADVIVSGDVSSAGSQGFRPLFNYISSNQISMTAPVLEEEISSEKWRVSFVMPHGSKSEDLPAPQDSVVTLRELPSHRAAVLRFHGRTTQKIVLEQEAKLLKLLSTHGFTVAGKARIARFDPPWMPPFARHNEVIIPIL